MVNQSTYTKLVEYINLDDIFIKELSMNREPISLKEGEEIEADIEMFPQLQIVNNTHLIATVSFHVTTQTRDNVDLFKINFEYATIYSIDTNANIPQDELESVAELFVRRNVPINVWPFARELISDLSNRMNVPRLLIGMYRYLPQIETDLGRDD